MTRPRGLLALGAAVLVAVTGCTVGEGEGEVTSDGLFVEDCWDGIFDLSPNFFGVNPTRHDQMMIRLQKGSNRAEISDGLLIVVNEVEAIRTGQLGSAIEVGVPVGVQPPGQAVEAQEPTLASMTLYLNDSCGPGTGALTSVSGSITFDALFSNDVDERNADERLTEATFDVTVADPRDASGGGESTVSGWFRFFFQRGQPAQPFP